MYVKDENLRGLTGRCRLRNGQIVNVEYSAKDPATPAAAAYCCYVSTNEEISLFDWVYWDINGDVVESEHKHLDIIENLENTVHE